MYKSLQAGRAIAAVLVVLFHLGGAIASEKYFGLSAFSIPFSFGDSGVEFFFVLSGFIIFSAHRQDICRPKRIGAYFRKRFIRIYPTYWIVFCGVYLAAISSTLRDTVPHDALVVIKSILLLPQDSSIVGGTGAPVLIVAWTLQYEVMFYVFFGCMILSRAISVLLGCSWLYIYLMFHGNSSQAFPVSFLSTDYIWLFLFGMIVSFICTLFSSKTVTPIGCVLIGGLIYSMVALDKVLGTFMFVQFRTLLYGIGSSFMIFGLVKAEDRGFVIGGSKWLQVLGDSSYALYLIHFPLISILCKLLILLHLRSLGVLGASLSFVLIFLSCLLCSISFHVLIEKNVIKYLRNLTA